MNQNETVLSKMMFKDESPINTVKRIKEILNRHDIQTTEKWNESGVPGCYSLRVTASGTMFGTNGKGITREFALASAYGEFMERLQIGSIFKGDQQKDGGVSTHIKSDAQVSAKDLLNRNNKWYKLYAEKLEKMTGVKMKAAEILEQYADANGNVPVTEFYCVNTQTKEYLPTELLRKIYSTNGCAAGNTIEEALVQAISEIVERHVGQRIICENIGITDISEDVLACYEEEYAIISFLRAHGFCVVIKNCSIDESFPVVCVLLIDEATGKYYTHFGAYPNFRIALQRALTETFQGKNINKIAQFDSFWLNTENEFNMGNLVRELVRGESEKAPEFFLPTGEQSKVPQGIHGNDNKELCRQCIAYVVSQGYDLLIRDHSCLGFDTYQVIVPGYSDPCIHRFAEDYNDLRYRRFVQPVLRSPSTATVEEIMGFMLDTAQSQKKNLAAQSFSTRASLPVQLSEEEELYFANATMANVNYTLGRYSETLKYVDAMLAVENAPDKEILICIKRYLMFKLKNYDKDKMVEVLRYFHKPDTVQYVFDQVKKHKNLLDRFVLCCDGRCEATCKFYGKCQKKHTDSLREYIHNKLHEMGQDGLPQKMKSLI